MLLVEVGKMILEERCGIKSLGQAAIDSVDSFAMPEAARCDMWMVCDGSPLSSKLRKKNIFLCMDLPLVLSLWLLWACFCVFVRL